MSKRKPKSKRGRSPKERLDILLNAAITHWLVEREPNSRKLRKEIIGTIAASCDESDSAVRKALLQYRKEFSKRDRKPLDLSKIDIPISANERAEADADWMMAKAAAKATELARKRIGVEKSSSVSQKAKKNIKNNVL